MKHILLACGLSLLALNGCAASSAIDDGGVDEDGGILPDGAGNKDAGNKETGPNACVALQCTSDVDCQNTCPPVQNGVECCDTATSQCYAYAQTSCPAPVPEAGTD